MYRLNNGNNVLNKWRNTEEKEKRSLRTSTFRISPELKEDIDTLVDHKDVPFDSRSELTRSLLQTFRDRYETKIELEERGNSSE